MSRRRHMPAQAYLRHKRFAHKSQRWPHPNACSLPSAADNLRAALSLLRRQTILRPPLAWTTTAVAQNPPLKERVATSTLAPVLARNHDQVPSNKVSPTCPRHSPLNHRQDLSSTPTTPSDAPAARALSARAADPRLPVARQAPQSAVLLATFSPPGYSHLLPIRATISQNTSTKAPCVVTASNGSMRWRKSSTSRALRVPQWARAALMRTTCGPAVLPRALNSLCLRLQHADRLIQPRSLWVAATTRTALLADRPTSEVNPPPTAMTAGQARTIRVLRAPRPPLAATRIDPTRPSTVLVRQAAISNSLFSPGLSLRASAGSRRS